LIAVLGTQMDKRNEYDSMHNKLSIKH